MGVSGFGFAIYVLVLLFCFAGLLGDSFGFTLWVVVLGVCLLLGRFPVVCGCCDLGLRLCFDLFDLFGFRSLGLFIIYTMVSLGFG